MPRPRESENEEYIRRYVSTHHDKIRSGDQNHVQRELIRVIQHAQEPVFAREALFAVYLKNQIGYAQ